MSGGIVVETNGKPTPASNKGWVAAAVGMFFLGPVGAIGGYFLGKKLFGEAQEQQELTSNKKVVEEPTFWNAKAAEGYVKGSVYGVLGGAAVVGIGFALGLVTAGAIGSVAAFLAAPVMLAGVGAMIFGGVFGLLKGGNDGKKEMAAEYQQAQEQQRSQSVSRGVSRQNVIEPSMQIEPPARTMSHLQEQKLRSAGAGRGGIA